MVVIMARLIRTNELKLDKVRHAGVIAGLKGRSTDQCPWDVKSKKAAWLEGWREGHESFKNGSFWLH